MKTHAPAQESAQQKAPAVAQAVPQLAQADSVFENARPEAMALQRVRNVISDSPRTTQLKSLQAMMNASPRAQALQTMQAMAYHSAMAIAQRQTADGMAATPLQLLEDEELRQGKFGTTQRIEDEELLQGKFQPVQRAEEEEPLQGKFAPVQRQDDEELLQGKFDPVQRVEDDEPLQRQTDGAASTSDEAPVRREVKPNNTGLPDQLKSGIESLSGISMDHVKVRYNSDKPAQLQAHAYAQGSEIHVEPGQERHLPHEAWHVVQQAQGRVRPTVQMKAGSPINDDVGLEHEADVMGAKALQIKMGTPSPLANVMQAPLAIAQLLPKLKNENAAIIYFEDHLLDEIAKNMAEIEDLASLAEEKGWEDLQERIIHYTQKFKAKKKLEAGAIDAPQQAKGNEVQSKLLFNRLDKSDIASLPALLSLLKDAQEYDWDDLEEMILSIVHKLEDERDFGIEKGKYQGISIEEVMASKSLESFVSAQDLFQSELTSMNGLQSAGFEFEFASFKPTGQPYTKEEIIPSHKLMAKARTNGNFFKLSWQLESDSENTLELVTPPFVFPKTPKGSERIRTLENDIGLAATGITENLGTLTQTAARFGEKGLGQGWQAVPIYRDFDVIKKMKSGSEVYGQINVSMYPEEIGAMLMERFEPHEKAFAAMTALEPEGMAILINRELMAKAILAGADDPPSNAVKQAIAIFARYCSNAVAIPSMRMRQATGKRHDTTPTQIKESLGVWVKTDALNLLKPILATPDDNLRFQQALLAGKPEILINFGKFARWMIQGVTPPPSLAPVSNKITLLDAVKVVMQENKWERGNSLIMPAARAYMEKTNAGIADVLPQIPPQVQWMTAFNENMMEEVNAFIFRAMLVAEHQEVNPTSTTEQFLEEAYGSGGGVRKGTHIKGVPTSRGKMYVTEIRPQM